MKSKWEVCCAQAGLPDLKMPRDVATRWNSTHDMLEFAVDYERPIKGLTVDLECKLTDLQLTEDEWKYAGELATALGVCSFFFLVLYTLLKLSKIFKEATLLFSRDDATVTTVIPHMDRIDRALTTDTTKLKFCTVIRAALLMGKRTLNRYYSKTDESELYRVAMGK